MKTFKEIRADYGTPESVKSMKKNTPGQNEGMSPAEKKAHAAAIAAFKKKGGKIKKLKPGYAQGWTGKDDLGTGQKGMLDKDDTKGFNNKKKFVRSMK